MYKTVIKKCLKWIKEQMLTFDKGRWGVYERIRTDLAERVVLCRPDTASEYMKVLWLFKECYRNKRNDRIYENIRNWLLYAQNNVENEGNAAFPFALIDGNKKYAGERTLYENDNAKIIINLLDLYRHTQDEKLKSAALACADFWEEIQTEEGFFYAEDKAVLQQPYPKATCFVLWMMAAQFECYAVTGEKRYLNCGEKALHYIYQNIEGNRIRSSYETAHTEEWRPISSETFIALLCLSRSYRILKRDDIKDMIFRLLDFAFSLIDEETGAVKNCDESSKYASLQNDEFLCDLVYTQGFALNAMIELYTVFQKKDYYLKAKKLADWLGSVQLNEKNPLIDGGWRGSYNLKLKKYYGKCTNALEEGGCSSVYTGWCALPIVMGLLKIESRKFDSDNF